MPSARPPPKWSACPDRRGTWLSDPGWESRDGNRIRARRHHHEDQLQDRRPDRRRLEDPLSSYGRRRHEARRRWRRRLEVQADGGHLPDQLRRGRSTERGSHQCRFREGVRRAIEADR